MEYQQQYVQPYHRHAPATNMRPAYPSINTNDAIYTPQEPCYHQPQVDRLPLYQLPPAHVLQYLSPPLVQQPSPASSYPSSIASSASRHSGQSYSSSPQSYVFTPPALLHQSSSLSAQSINYQPRQPPLRANARAIIIGINYFTQKGELSPATNASPTSTGPNPCRDARNLYTYLIQVKHYAPENIILLTDDQNGVYGQPTRKNILDALNWIGETAGANTSTSSDRKGKGRAGDPAQEKVIIYYSGHGRVSTQGKSKSSNPSTSPKKTNKQSRHSANNNTRDEESGGLETIYPVDFRSFPKGQICPDEIDEKIRPAKKRGVKLTLIFDAYTGVR